MKGFCARGSVLQPLQGFLRALPDLSWFTNSTILRRGIFYFIKPKENDDGDLADFLFFIFFLRFLLYSSAGCGAPPKVTFFRVILNTVI